MNKKIINELDELFTFAPPDELRRSVNQVYFSYLIHTEVLPQDYKKTMEDFYFLIDFLEKVHVLYKKEKTNGG
jgi:hypothetical protein